MTPISDHHSDQQEEMERQARNNAALMRFAILLAVAVTIAAMAPSALFAATLSSFLMVFSIGTALAAGLARDSVRSPFLTRWDQAAGLLFLAILAKAFVDPVALQQVTGGS